MYALCSCVFNFANTKQTEHLLHIQHTCTMHSTSIPWSCVKQTCEAVCPLNRYLHKCTSRSFKCIWNVGFVLLHIKIVVSTGMFWNNMCQWHLHMYKSKQGNCCIKDIMNIKSCMWSAIVCFFWLIALCTMSWLT